MPCWNLLTSVKHWVLQGRLDYMQRDMTSFIEMKSGKADEYSIKRWSLKENNKVQMLLYQAVLEYSMGMDHRRKGLSALYPLSVALSGASFVGNGAPCDGCA